VITVSGKRAEVGQDPLTQASPGQLSTSLPGSPGSPSTSDYASGVHQETTNPIQLPSSASGEMRRPPYASGGTELPWNSLDDTESHLLTPGSGGVQQVQPGTTSELPPPSSMRTETYPFVANTEIGPATPSESSGEISQAPASWSKELTPWEKGEYLADQTPTKPQPKSALGKLASKSKSFFRKLAKISKSLVSEMVDNPKLQLR
jgi:hypothetical protein